MDTHDKEEGYCRTLGHYVPFIYCRTMKDGVPCHRILDCWFERFPVDEFLKAHYSQEEIASILEPPRPKISSLIDLIEKARKG
jgi:hypothetical protein